MNRKENAMKKKLTLLILALTVSLLALVACGDNGGSENNGIEVTLSNNVAESAMPMSEAAVEYMIDHLAQN